MRATLKYDTKHLYRVAMGPAAAPTEQSSRISLALSETFRVSGVPYPGNGLDYESLRVSAEGDMLTLTYIRHNYDAVEYDNVSERADSVELLIHRSSVTSGIPGVIAESIKFTIEED
jgi:hypothetical protein